MMAELTKILLKWYLLPSSLGVLCYGAEKSWIQVGTDLHLYNNVIHSTTASTSISCGVECSLNPECLGFDFRPWEGRCTFNDAANMTIINLQTQHAAEHETLNFVHMPEICDQSAGICLMFVNTEMSWNDGRSFCQAFNMDLAILDTDEKWNFAKKAGAGITDPYFVGASDLDVRMDWRWLNGQPVDPHKWRNNEPSGGQEHCATFYSTGNRKMNDLRCYRPLYIMCGK